MKSCQAHYISPLRHSTGIQVAGSILGPTSFMEIGHEMISTSILSLPLFQTGQLSVTGESMGT